MNGQRDTEVAIRATNVRSVDGHTRDQDGVAPECLGGRKRVHDLARHHFLLEDVLHVHDRCLARDRDRFLDRPHAQLAVDRRCERG